MVSQPPPLYRQGCAGTDTITASCRDLDRWRCRSRRRRPQRVHVSRRLVHVLAGTGGEALVRLHRDLQGRSTTAPTARSPAAVNFDLSTRAAGRKLNGQAPVSCRADRRRWYGQRDRHGDPYSHPGWVTAVLAEQYGDQEPVAQSDDLHGAPDPDRFSLAVETFNIEGAHIDGVTTKLKCACL